MHITKIEVNEVDPIDRDRREGYVSFSALGRKVQVFCEIRSEARQEKGDAKGSLIQEALRQIRRMPEYRSGKSKITFEPGLLTADPVLS